MNCSSKSRIIPIAFFSLALFGAVANAAPNKGAAYFESKVRPLLIKHCSKCHGAKKQKGNLRLDSREAMIRGGELGAALVPKRPGESLLIQAVRYEDADMEMPPDGRLADSEIAALTKWIQMGAPWPGRKKAADDDAPRLGDQEHIGSLARTHWSLQPIANPKPPSVKNTDWVRNDIDRFILARLEAKGIEPAPMEKRFRLIRRLSFNLLGLPPTPKEVADFVNDKTPGAPGAYARLVNRMLASPHYGERWARHWLDVARYADTSSDTQVIRDPRYPYAYTYRNYVVRAMNDDKPYDQFIIEQLAADQVVDRTDAPELAALGFLTVGPEERGDEAIADRIDVVTRGLMGMTVACARCHDHKYDPIPTTDYYALHGVFDSVTQPSELPIIDIDKPAPDQIADFEKQLKAVTDKFDAFKEKLRAEAVAAMQGRYAEHFRAYHQIQISKTATVRKLITGKRFKETTLTPLARNLDAITRGGIWRKHPIMGPWADLVRLPNARFRDAFVVRMKKSTGTNALVLKALKDADPKNSLELVTAYGKLFDDLQREKETTSESKAASGILVFLDNPKGPFAFTAQSVANAYRLLGAGRVALSKHEKAIASVENEHPGSPARAMVLRDLSKPRDSYVHIRGQRDRRGDVVKRRFLTCLSEGEPTAFKQGSGRLELARSIADKSNPLTARVMVNRVWMLHFGEGLVSTPGDFGIQTPKPLHADLLDHLATRFMLDGWSLMKLHRYIVHSATFRQTSRLVPKAMAKMNQIDPENKLLWRFNRRRLEFEAMRDAVLRVAGRLDPTPYGRTYKLDQVDSQRRTLYAFIDRVNPDSLRSTFDFPSPDATAPKRTETLVPQQALFVMNSPFMIEQTRHLAAIDKGKPFDARLDNLYARLFSRKALPHEHKLAKAFLAETNSHDEEDMRTVWSYGYGPADPEAPVDEQFHPLKHFDSTHYRYGAVFPAPAPFGHLRLGASHVHPGRNRDHAAVRRWTAPAEMIVSISGEAEHQRDKGDGVMVTVLLGRKDATKREVLARFRIFNDVKALAISDIEVKAGDTIDFALDCFRNGASDSSHLRPVIQPADGSNTWSAQSQFAGPPPPLLEPWEQLCQALLLTNEFLYVD